MKPLTVLKLFAISFACMGVLGLLIWWLIESCQNDRYFQAILSVVVMVPFSVVGTATSSWLREDALEKRVELLKRISR